MNQPRHAHARHWVVSALAVLLAGCASQGPFVSRTSGTTHRLELVPSAYHHFELVHLDESAGLLTVYGKVRHPTSHRVHEAHVDMTVTPPGAQRTDTVGLPLRNVDQRRRGWAGAAFRVRRPGNLPTGSV